MERQRRRTVRLVCAAVLFTAATAATVSAQTTPRGEPAAPPRRPTLNPPLAEHAPSESTKLPLPARDSGSTATRGGRSRTAASTNPLWGTVIALGVIVSTLVCGARWLRKHGPAGLRALPPDALEPLGQRVLSRGVTLHLVRCGGRMLVLGSGPDGVRTLAEITDPVEVDLLAGICRQRDEAALATPAFATLFQRPAPVANFTAPQAAEARHA